MKISAATIWMSGIVVIAGAAPVARAQEGEAEEGADSTSSGLTWTLTPFFRYNLPAGLEGNNGDFSVWRTGVGYGLSGPAGEEADFNLGIGYEYNNYEFDQPNSFLPGVTNEPFSEIHILDVGLNFFGKANGDGWGWFGGVSGRVAGEGDAEFSDSATWGGMAGVSHRVNDELSYSLGVRAMTQIEDDVLVLPAITLDWRINDQWRFVFAGTRAELAYALAEDLSLGIGAGWENRRFRLDDDAPNLGAVIEDSSAPIFVRLSKEVNEGFNVDLTAGFTAYSEFEIADRNGNGSRTIEGDPAAFLGLSVQWAF